MAYINGIDGYVYYGSSGTQAATLLNSVGNVTLSSGTVEADVTTKQSGFTLTGIVRLDVSASFDIIADPSDAGYDALRTAYTTKAPLSMLFCNGPKATTGTLGFDADFVVSQFDEAQDNADKMRMNVTVKPAKTARQPTWFEAT